MSIQQTTGSKSANQLPLIKYQYLNIQHKVLHNIITNAIKNENITQYKRAYNKATTTNKIDDDKIILHEQKPVFPDRAHKEIRKHLKSFKIKIKQIKPTEQAKPLKSQETQLTIPKLLKTKQIKKEK